MTTLDQAAPDSNVESVRQQLLERSQVGLTKYGTTTERTDLTTLDWINHAQQEAMDLAVYLERVKKDIVRKDALLKEAESVIEKLLNISHIKSPTWSEDYELAQNWLGKVSGL